MTDSDALWPKGSIRATGDPTELRGGLEYGPMHWAHRLLNDRLTGAALSPELEKDVTARLEELVALLEPHQVIEHFRIDGLRPDLPGRGHPLLPPFVIDVDAGEDEDDDPDQPTVMRGRVTFGRFHLGGGAVHGGVLPLLFDDVFGRLVNVGRPSIARTAYLKIDYRRVTRLDVELFWDISLDRVEGRKRFATGRLTDADGALLAEADGLFVELLPGQP